MDELRNDLPKAQKQVDLRMRNIEKVSDGFSDVEIDRIHEWITDNMGVNFGKRATWLLNNFEDAQWLRLPSTLA